MHPTFQFLQWEIPAYTLFTCLGALAAAALALPALIRAGLGRAQAAWLLACMCAAFLAGARLWNVAVNPSNYLGSLRWYSLRLSGLSLYGGLTGALATLILALRLWKKPLRPAMDAMAIPGGISFCLCRIGCFLNGCCAGRATSSPLGIRFPSKASPLPTWGAQWLFLSAADRLHPTQLYELAGAALGIPLVLLLRRKDAKAGTLFWLYCAWFSAMRLAILPFRALTYAGLVKDVIYPLLYGGLVVAGLVLAYGNPCKILPKPHIRKSRTES